MVNLAAITAGIAVWLWQGSSAAQRLSPALASRTLRMRWRRLASWLDTVPTTARARRIQPVRDEIPVICELLAVCLDAGLPLRNAVRCLLPLFTGPIHAALAQVDARVRLGTDEALAWSELRGEPGWGELADELSRSAASGIGISQAVRGLGASARAATAAQAHERARSVGVRSVLPLMVCFLPAFMLLGIVPIIGGVIAELQ
ncbi:MAG: type II secretion system F family protein [Propionibacteriaceae bacterium]|jgi:Flp pilus assembly protein TadB|nr:type II secretion system F family protein [Propionibacteriaceae bacterium]